MVEISLKDLIKVYGLASIGKLVGGVIHNINGPLQNLGMDLEMLNLTSANHGLPESDMEKKIDNRLKRMNEEFESLIQLVKTASMKVNMMEDVEKYFNLNHFLQEEISFLKANLYFKHNVQMTIELADQSPLLGELPEGVPLSLSWFLQGLIEVVERHEIKKMGLKTISSPPVYQVILTTEGERLPDRFLALLEMDGSSSEILQIENEDVGMKLALFCIKTGGGSLTYQSEGSRSNIIFKIPIS